MLMEWQLFQQIFAAKDIKKDTKQLRKPRRGDEAEIEQNTRSL